MPSLVGTLGTVAVNATDAVAEIKSNMVLKNGHLTPTPNDYDDDNDDDNDDDF